ncbi:MAG: tRNA adenosine(34) deaminase TadA [Christensenellales bacterium]
MKEALSLAQAAYDQDEVPVGAVVVSRGRIIGRGYNQRMGRRDPTAHAEILAIRDAAEHIGDWRLSGCTLYVTLEPCAMCAGAIVQARLDAVIFGAYDEESGCAGSRRNMLQDQRIGGRVRLAGGLMHEQCAALLKSYFEKRR